jgi:hypothetical protein
VLVLRYYGGLSEAVDQAAGNLYVTSPDPSLVTVINTSTCSARDVSGCAGHLTVTRGGVDPVQPAGDQASHNALPGGRGGEHRVHDRHGGMQCPPA